MSACEQCGKGTLLEEKTERSLEVHCSHCKRGWHIPLTPSHVSPCMDPRFSPPEPREVIRDPDDEDRDRDEKTEEDEE